TRARPRGRPSILKILLLLLLRIANYSLTKRILANFPQALAFLPNTSFCQEKEVLWWFGVPPILHFSLALLFPSLLRGNAQGHSYRKPQAFFILTFFAQGRNLRPHGLSHRYFDYYTFPL
ncbi:MAG: hypothetical protein MJZ42_03585, partial [Bacteroidales bacterium]|nr:hypothetical protein [Bacteroidales bacterium]